MPEASDRSFRIVISCGGTGGHFYPGLSIAECAEKRGCRAKLLLSGRNSSDQCGIASGAGIEAAAVAQLPNPFKKPFSFLKLLFSALKECGREMREFQPDALLCMGSFTALPAFLAAKQRKIPVFLHDGNAKIGKANRWMSRFARFLGTAFPAVNATSCGCPVETVGMPLRPALLEWGGVSKREAVAALDREFGTDFSPEGKILLVFGGSQGAGALNRVIPEAVARHPEIQVIHLTGKGNANEVRKLYSGVKSLVLERSEKMGLFYAACDAVVSRSGGSSVAEILYFGKRALLIPYPYAAEDHQRANASYPAEKGDAVLLDNAECTAEKVSEILANENFFLPGERNRALARPDAAERMLAIIGEELFSGGAKR